MNVRIVGEETKIEMTKPEENCLAKAKLILKAYARVTPSLNQREKLEEAIEEIGSILAGATEEAVAAG